MQESGNYNSILHIVRTGSLLWLGRVKVRIFDSEMVVTSPCYSAEALCFSTSQANLRAIISSEKQVTQLMSSIDEALAEVARVEETLQIYDELLGSVKQQMDHIHRENSLLHRIVSNKAKLVDEILFLTVRGFAKT